MARPRKDGMDYFPHDVNATGDKKIEALRILYGNDGYAFYFILLEMIYQEPNFELDVSDAETIQILVKKTEVSQEKFNSMLETAIKRECFDRERYENDRILTSNGIKKRASVVVEKRDKMRKAYEESKSGKEKRVSDAETPTETPEETPQSKSKREVKEKKKDIKKEYADYVFLTETEYGKLTELLGDDDRDQYFLRFASWISGKTKREQQSRSAYLSILNWHREDQKKLRPFPQRQQNNGTQIVNKWDRMIAEEEAKQNGTHGYHQTGTDLFG